MRSVELFTGAGGLALGLHFAEFKHVALVESDEDACATLLDNRNRKSVPGIDDWNVLQDSVTNIDYSRFGDIDLLAGGVPCQPFSVAGKQLGRADNRNMFPEFFRAVRELRPRAFLVENVKGLLWERLRRYFEYIRLQLELPLMGRRKSEQWRQHSGRLARLISQPRRTAGELEYTVHAKVLNAADYGVPQWRERVFLVGFRKDLKVEWECPEPTHSLKQLLSDQWITQTYWRRLGIRTPSSPSKFAARRLKALRAQDLNGKKPWVTLREALGDLPAPRRQTAIGNRRGHVVVEGARTYPGHTGSSLDLPAKTLKAGVHGVPGGENMLIQANGKVRYFTLREAARLQCFPDSWELSGDWSDHIRQLGNAVPVELARVLGLSVAKALSERTERRAA